MPIKICSHSTAMQELRLCPDELAVVCITNKNHPVPPPIIELAGSLLHLEFDDCEFDSPEYQMPTKEQVDQALKFSKKHDDLIVCCHAGVRRSSALAYVIECSRVKHPALACGVWEKNKHNPNKLIIKYGGEILNNLEVEKQYTKWINK